MQLSQNELRVIGCLIEKSLTTPDQYPLSLNGLTNACNQKSNRDPVLYLSEPEVQNTLDLLTPKGLVFTQSGATSRVAKYKHRFCNTEFGELQLTPQELAILCVLFLRGPQTPGELRTRTNRLCDFSDVNETELVLDQLCQADEDGNAAKIIKLPREPGKRESRYAHCFGDSDSLDATNFDSSDLESATPRSNAQTADSIHSAPQHAAENNYESRIAALEEQVALLQMEIEELTIKVS